MGWEVELNAITPKCTLIDRVVNNEIDAELLSFVRTYFRLRRVQKSRVNEFARGDAGNELFVDALEELVEAHPHIEDRYCNLERRFDWLKWLLTKCAEGEEETLLAVTSIDGEAQVHPSARSVQGFQIKWTLPDECQLIHIWLDGLTEKDIASKYEPSIMRDAQLYKWGPPTDTEAALEWIIEDFTALKKFYEDVAVRSEAVLVVAD